MRKALFLSLVLCITSAFATDFPIFAGQSRTKGANDGPNLSAFFNQPLGMTIGSDGTIYVVSQSSNNVRTISNGMVTTYAGCTVMTGFIGGAANGTLQNARFNKPKGIVVTPTGVLYIADGYNSTIRKIENGMVSTIAGQATVHSFLDGTGTAATFNDIYQVALDLNGDILVADSGNNAIRRVTPEGVVSTVAIGFSVPKGVAVDSLGNIFVADTGNNRICKISNNTVTVLAGEGHCGLIDGNGAAAYFSYPHSLAVDPANNIFVTMGYGAIRKVTQTGEVTTVFRDAAYANTPDFSPCGIAIHNGYVYSSDWTNGNIHSSAEIVAALPPPPPPYLIEQIVEGMVGVPFSFQIAATNNPTSFDAVALETTKSGRTTLSTTLLNTIDALKGVPNLQELVENIKPSVEIEKPISEPAGLTVNKTNGLISGTPITAGITEVTISATNSGGTGSTILTIKVVAAPIVVSNYYINPKNGCIAGTLGGFVIITGSHIGTDVKVNWNGQERPVLTKTEFSVTTLISGDDVAVAGTYPIELIDSGTSVATFQFVVREIKDGKNGIDGVNGINGKDGVAVNGKDGINGLDGKNGIDGTDGKDGVSPTVEQVVTVLKNDSEFIQMAKGKDGTNGKDGINGLDGKNGIDGKNGNNGNEGKNGSDGINGNNGKDGLDGKNGKDGCNGKDGLNGKDGAEGKCGKDGLNGKDGKDGCNGRDGKDGNSGKDGSCASVSDVVNALKNDNNALYDIKKASAKAKTPSRNK